MEHNEVLNMVIDGLKCNIPISKTLKKLKYNRTTFYSKCDEKMIRRFNELKCLKTINRTKIKRNKNDYFGDYNILEVD